MAPTIIDGRAIAEQERLQITAEVARLKERDGWTPGLAVVLVGNDPASDVYVASKASQINAVGMRSFEHRLPAETSQEALLSLISQLNANDEIDGILVQLPLPSHIDADVIIRAVDPAKDVDGLYPENAGRLVRGLTSLVPSVPGGVGPMTIACLLRNTLQAAVERQAKS